MLAVQYVLNSQHAHQLASVLGNHMYCSAHEKALSYVEYCKKMDTGSVECETLQAFPAEWVLCSAARDRSRRACMWKGSGEEQVHAPSCSDEYEGGICSG